MTSKQRAKLRSMANSLETIMQIGKGGINENTYKAVEDALLARELIKISVLQNCVDDPRDMAEMLAERTHSQVVQVIGKKIVLFRQAKKNSKYLPEK